ncbi:DUF3299 domain-containing protein [Marinicellulosiphila megalodicopiae]|uniref:DUF3299 domain-containing protein n=1 Tax=Marinicellulosiphila megalodicopiae TaxID=2724896 RepID=UPI003BAEBA41
MNSNKYSLSIFILFFAGILALSACQKANINNVEQIELTYKEISWDDLLPEEEKQIQENTESAIEASIMQSFGFDIIEAKMVDELNNQYIKIPGFIVPLEMKDDAVTQFFLVPYYGACIHTPPPPKNQMLYITTQPFVLEDMDAPVWVEGKINVEETHSNSMGTSGYSIKADNIYLY